MARIHQPPILPILGPTDKERIGSVGSGHSRPVATLTHRRRGRYDAGMLSQEKLEAYRRMTPEERWREVEELMTVAWRTLLELPIEERNRRLEIIRQDHEASDAIMLERLRKLP